MALLPYTRLLEYHDRLISLSPYEICIANLGTYKREPIPVSIPFPNLCLRKYRRMRLFLLSDLAYGDSE